MNLSALLEASPDAALLSLFAGVLLIYFECNRPGSIIPGCAGVLLALLSIHAFAHMPLRSLALGLVAAGIVLILAELKVSARNLAAATGTALLIFGFRNLLQPFAPARVHTPTAIVAAAGFAASTLWLARVALRARHNKRSLSPVPGFPAASERRTG